MTAVLAAAGTPAGFQFPAVFQSVLSAPAQTFVPAGIAVGVGVGVLVRVLVGVMVGVGVPVLVGVWVGVLVGIKVGVFVGVTVGVLVVAGVLVGVSVGVTVGVIVGVIVGVGVPVQAKTLTEFVVAADTGVPLPVSVALPLTLSVKNTSIAPQAGAVSFRLPVHVSVAVPFGPSVVTGFPLWMQGAAAGVPPGKGTVFVTATLITLLAGSRF
jgi:hypothetical protein